MNSWYNDLNTSEVPSPSLLINAAMVEGNIQRMIALVKGNVARLRPHMKTHKMPEIIKLHLKHGVTKFKCATIAEAEMTAAAGAADILLAYPPVGPNIKRLIALIKQFPQTYFSTVTDSEEAVDALSSAALEANVVIPVYLDVDCGMHRTGISPGREAVSLYAHLSKLPGLVAAGLHVYDGHIHDHDPLIRELRVNEAYDIVDNLLDRLLARGLSVPNYIAGGTPTFAIHARRGDYECSPGTCVLWDYGYGIRFADLDFNLAALLLTRVISKPTPGHLTLDLGHKAVASEMPHPRVYFLNLPDATAVMHSEEHLVVQTEHADDFKVGDVLYGVPWHICPTVALHSKAYIVRHEKVTETWKIEGRDRQLTV
ncbi:D-TA family PLP-dependent enzyme [soil metagenome]